MKKIITALALASALIVPATASAMTTTQAKRMVQAEIRFEIYGNVLDRPDVTCRRLSYRAFNCRWETMTRKSVAAGEGNPYGVAYVRGSIVRLSVWG